MGNKEKVLKCIGVFPKKPTNVDVEREQQPFATKKQCDIFRVWYNVEENERVCSYLLTPKKVGTLMHRYPCVLLIHQHGGEFNVGKSEPAGLGGSAINHYGPRLCELGFAVFCPDMLCFEDRRPSSDIRRKNGGMMEAHGYENYEFFSRLLHGSTLQAKYLHDLSVALDIMEQQPDIDSTRIASMGHSLGGQEALWLAWYDSRIKAVVSSCGSCMLQQLIEDHIVHNKALYLPSLLREVGDMDVILSDLRDCSIFMVSGVEDVLLPIQGVESLVKIVQSTANIKFVAFNGGHEFPLDMQRHAYEFLQHELAA